MQYIIHVLLGIWLVRIIGRALKRRKARNHVVHNNLSLQEWWEYNEWGNK